MIKLVGDPFDSFVNKDFDIKRGPARADSRGKGSNFMRNALCAETLHP